MKECAVKGLTAKGKALVQKLRDEKKEAEIMEKEIQKNTDDTVKCFQIKKGNEIVGKVMINVSKIFKATTTSIHEQDKIQQSINHILLENGLIYK